MQPGTFFHPLPWGSAFWLGWDLQRGSKVPGTKGPSPIHFQGLGGRYQGLDATYQVLSGPFLPPSCTDRTHIHGDALIWAGVDQNIGIQRVIPGTRDTGVRDLARDHSFLEGLKGAAGSF